MSSVRAWITFQELHNKVVTFKYDSSIVANTDRYGGSNGSAQIGKAVAKAADSTVGLGSTGNWPLGTVQKVDPDGFCSVVVGGIVAMPYVANNANPPLLGRGVQVDGSGNAISPAGGARLATERGIVLSLDSSAGLAYVLFPTAG